MNNSFSLQALRVAIAGFIVPFMAVYSPALMLQGGGALATAYVVFKALIAIGMWGAGAIGFLFGPLNLLERLAAIVAAARTRIRLGESCKDIAQRLGVNQPSLSGWLRESTLDMLYPPLPPCMPRNRSAC